MAIVRFNLQLGNRLPFHDAVIYKRGAIVNGNQSNVSIVTVHQGHDMIVGDKFYYALASNNVRRDRVFQAVTSVNATQVRFTGANSANKFSFPDQSLLVPLGSDTGAVQQPDGSWSEPNFDGSTISVYSDPHGDGSYLNSIVPITAGGDLGFWCSTSDLWILCRDSKQSIKQVYIVSQSSASGGSAGGVVVAADTSTPGDNNNPSFLVVRANGVGDILYVWVKDSTDAYHWEQILQIA